jgi:cytidylate kinase
MAAKGETVNYEEVLANVKERDERDQNRADSGNCEDGDACMVQIGY